jgi:vaccinia related kinase
MAGVQVIISHIVTFQGHQFPTTAAEINLPHNMEASNSDDLPGNTWEGEILVDTAKNKWRLGQLIGEGGFGEVYLVSSNINEIVNSDAQYVVKLEPYSIGYLAPEFGCYKKIARSKMIDNWKRHKYLNH